MTIEFIEHRIDYYIERLSQDNWFSIVSFGDAEWYSIMRYDLCKATGLGQILHGPTGDKLLSVLKKRQGNSNFLISTPKVLWTLEDCVSANIGRRIENLLKSYNLDIVFYERDIMNDDVAEAGKLFSFINQLQKMDVVVIGPRELRGLEFLGCKHFVEISTPNLHLEQQGIENAVADALMYGKPAVYLVSAGVSAPIIIDKICDKIPNSFFIDCGSIWDAFVGIGSQREWRAELYSDPDKLKRWRHDNLYGKD